MTVLTSKLPDAKVCIQESLGRSVKTRIYEMLAGHNRQNAAKLAGLTEVPAIVKTDLTEQEAYVYVIETNVMQRGFAELLPSEKAAVLAERYEKVSSQGKRNTAGLAGGKCKISRWQKLKFVH